MRRHTEWCLEGEVMRRGGRTFKDDHHQDCLEEYFTQRKEKRKTLETYVENRHLKHLKLQKIRNALSYSRI